MELELKIENARSEQLELIESFLRPFAEANQILPRSRSEVEALIPNGFVALVENEVVGFAAVEIYSRKLAEIQCLTVSSEQRGKGIGQKLVQLCVSRAKEQNVVEVMAITTTEDLFRRCGFDYSLPQQKRALFFQTNDRSETTAE